MPGKFNNQVWPAYALQKFWPVPGLVADGNLPWAIPCHARANLSLEVCSRLDSGILCFWLDAQRLLGTWKRPSGKYFEGAHRKISLRPLTFRKRWCYIGLYPRRNGHRLFEVRVPWISNSWKKRIYGFLFSKTISHKETFFDHLCFLVVWSCQPRLYVPRKPTLREIYLSDADYAELSTKFKACHVKNMIFWIARKTQEVADAAPEVS